MLENIRAHSIVVAGIAELISARMRDTGVDISMDVVTAAALLHDISKTSCLNSEERHEVMGKQICLKHGFFEIADIVREHVVLRNGLPAEGITEREIVYYSDKRVNHDKVVPLTERLEYILKRYGRDNDQRYRMIMDNFQICQAVENRIFEHLDFEPDELAGMMESNIP